MCETHTWNFLVMVTVLPFQLYYCAVHVLALQVTGVWWVSGDFHPLQNQQTSLPFAHADADVADVALQNAGAGVVTLTVALMGCVAGVTMLPMEAVWMEDAETVCEHAESSYSACSP